MSDRYDIPESTIESLVRYRDNRIPTGGFLHAVLANDLMGAIGRADNSNLAAIVDICRWVRWEMPALAHGSEDAVAYWLKGEGAES